MIKIIKNIFAAIIYLTLPFILIYLQAYKFGIGISPDSCQYISIAGNIAAHLNYATSITGWSTIGTSGWIALWAPLYPVFLSPVILLFDKPEFSLAVVNSLLFAFSVFLTGRLFSKISPDSKYLNFTLQFVVLLSLVTLKVFSFVWSETLFIPLIVLYFYFLFDYLKNPNLKYFVFLCLAALILSLIKYSGVIFVLLTFIVLIIENHRSEKKLFSPKYIAVLLVSAVPFFLVIFLNFLNTKTMFGSRVAAASDLVNELIFSLDTISRWLLPGLIPETIRVIFLICLIIALLYALMKRTGMIKKFTGIILLYCFLYFCTVVAVRLSVKIDPLNYRLLSPVFIPLMLIIFYFISRIKSKLIITVVILYFLIFSSFKAYNYVSKTSAIGVGEFSISDWRSSELMSSINKNVKGKIIYSNFPDAINYFTHLPAKWIPESVTELEDFRRIITTENAAVIWFEKAMFRNVVSLGNLLKVVQIDSAKNYSDGFIIYNGKHANQ